MGFDENIGETLKDGFMRALREKEARQQGQEIEHVSEQSFAPTVSDSGFADNLGEQLVKTFMSALREAEARQTQPVVARTIDPFTPTR